MPERTALDTPVGGMAIEVLVGDAKESECSVKYGFRITSYLVEEEQIGVVTEANRLSICLLLPSKY